MVYFVLVFALVLSSCQTAKKASDKPVAAKADSPTSDIARAAARPVDPGKVIPEVSLKEDRSAMAELRKDEPEDIKTENDEGAAITKLFADNDVEPQKIREKFDKMIRKSRDKLDKILRKKREDYSKKEQKKREAFLKKLGDERKNFGMRKPTPAQRTEFERDQDAARKDHFADERDDRKEFESEVAEQRSTFDDYAREKRADFEQLWREYKSAYDHRKRALEKKQEMARKQMRLENEGKAVVSPAAIPVVAPTPYAAEETESGAQSAAAVAPGGSHTTSPGAAGTQSAQHPKASRKNQLPLKAGQPLTTGTPDADLEDFKKIPKGPGQPLAPPKDGK